MTHPRRFRVCIVDGVPKMESRAIVGNAPPRLSKAWADGDDHDMGADSEEAAVAIAVDFHRRDVAFRRQRLAQARAAALAAEEAHLKATGEAEAVERFAAKRGK